MVTEAPSTVRVRRLRERRSRGVALIAQVEIGEGGLGLLVVNWKSTVFARKVTFLTMGRRVFLISSYLALQVWIRHYRYS